MRKPKKNQAIFAFPLANISKDIQPVDKKAKDILFKTYWTSSGWANEENRKNEAKEFEYAKEKGLMFDALTITKPELSKNTRNHFDHLIKKNNRRIPL